MQKAQSPKQISLDVIRMLSENSWERSKSIRLVFNPDGKLFDYYYHLNDMEVLSDLKAFEMHLSVKESVCLKDY
jgi:hypothetical protein